MPAPRLTDPGLCRSEARPDLGPIRVEGIGASHELIQVRFEGLEKENRTGISSATRILFTYSSLGVEKAWLPPFPLRCSLLVNVLESIGILLYFLDFSLLSHPRDFPFFVSIPVFSGLIIFFCSFARSASLAVGDKEEIIGPFRGDGDEDKEDEGSE
jgi:hypothetical protein